MNARFIIYCSNKWTHSAAHSHTLTLAYYSSHIHTTLTHFGSQTSIHTLLAYSDTHLIIPTHSTQQLHSTVICKAPITHSSHSTVTLYSYTVKYILPFHLTLQLHCKAPITHSSHSTVTLYSYTVKYILHFHLTLQLHCKAPITHSFHSTASL